MGTDIATITAADLTGTSSLGPTLLELNNTHAQSLSWLEPERLRHLVMEAFFAARIGEADALLIAFDQNADYDSPNFRWFQARFSRFVYVDRIVVAATARGRGFGRLLYRRLFTEAAQRGHDKIVCEVNRTPPNPGSDAFHAALGFSEIGSASIHAGQKQVRYLAHDLAR